ncbi:hypothetical protein ACM61V_04710 [Sphingomonas sp. TX0543]|uniref:hypothetical protein n=1 Tax=unclassified Sphingomonas TaxID=196159 RepID=UPI0010F45C76|nr:hypothetical protein [Sphingomonas sp. 3P27F8]
MAGMTAGRDWWQLRAFDVAPWIRSLPVSIRTDKHNRLGWLGRPWDGHNDLPVGEWAWDGERELDEAEPLVDDIDAWDGTIVPGHELKKLIAELRRLIAAKPGLGVALPDYRDVRATLVGEEGDVSEPTSAMAVVDFDIGEMILPIGIDDWQLRPDTWRPVEEVAALMVSMLVDTLSSRRKLLRRERKMREGFERDVARFGGGASPLWLRMEPVRFTSRRSKLFRQPYVALDVELGIYQVWAPSGLEQVSSAPRLRKVYSRRGSGHCRNVERLKVLRATGSIGWISDVALALIEQAGRNPAAVFKQELDAALHDGSHDHYGCDGHFGALFCHYGVLNPFFTFDGGCYSDGTLTLDGRYPEVLALGAPGRLLAQYVDHPAFVAAGAVIERSEWSEERLKLYHTPRLFTVEEAERRWSGGRTSE